MKLPKINWASKKVRLAVDVILVAVFVYHIAAAFFVQLDGLRFIAALGWFNALLWFLMFRQADRFSNNLFRDHVRLLDHINRAFKAMADEADKPQAAKKEGGKK